MSLVENQLKEKIFINIIFEISEKSKWHYNDRFIEYCTKPSSSLRTFEAGN